MAHYRQRGAEPVRCNSRRLRSLGYQVMVAPLQGARPSATLRHDPRSLALAVMRFFRQIRRDGHQAGERRSQSPSSRSRTLKRRLQRRLKRGLQPPPDRRIS